MNTLIAEHLARSFKRRQVVKDVTLSVEGGNVVGLLGPNGAGKTTSFYMIVGLIKANKGRVLLGDKDITSLSIDERAKLGIGYLPQESSIFTGLNVEKNIMAILQLRKDLNRKKRKETCEELLDSFNITHLRDNSATSLSGGERRRVEIARCLAINPKFVLLDEPFAGIDPISIIDIKKMISILTTRGIGVLITDHNVRETLDICDHAYIVNQGEIIASGDADTILANQQVKDVYLGEEFDL